MHRSKSNGENPKSEPYREQRLLKLVLWILLIGIATIFFYSLSFGFSVERSSFSKGAEIFSINMGIAGAALAVGGLLGFLFGIPRSEIRVKAESDRVSEQAEGNQSKTRSIERYGDNDSLEQISDWLTKILLGVGLAQISSLSGVLSNLASRIESIANGSSLGVFGVSIFVIYIVFGFIGGYLWARFSIRTELTRRDQRLSEMIQTNRSLINDVKNDVEAVRSELNRDFEVLLQLYEQIEPYAPLIDAEQEKEIIEAFQKLLREASSRVRLEVFRQVQNIRAQTWKNDKARMARTIPIFKALVLLEEEAIKEGGTNKGVFGDNFHRVLAEIGFAIKDKTKATHNDYRESRKYLEKAIKERDLVVVPWDIKKRPWLAYYEFNYVFCLFGYLSDSELEQETIREEIERKLIAVHNANLLKSICKDDDREQVKRMLTWMQTYSLDKRFGLDIQ